MHDFIYYKRPFIYLVSYFIFDKRSLLFSIFVLVTRPLDSAPRADSSDDDTFSDSTEEEPCKVRKKLFLTAYKILAELLPACRRLLFPLLHAEKGRPFSACNKGNRRRLHEGKQS